MKKRSRLFGKRFFVYDFLRVTGFLPGLIWYRPKFVYESKEAKKRVRGGAVLISNHVGFFDPIYCMYAMWYRRQHFVCLKELYDRRPFWLFHNILTIPIDRENFNMNSLRQIEDELTSGSVVTIFPEGHINSSGELAAFKSGMVLMALRGKAPIVPLYIREKKRFWSRLVFAFGEEVYVEALCGRRPTMAQIEEVTALLKEKEEHLKELTEKRKANSL